MTHHIDEVEPGDQVVLEKNDSLVLKTIVHDDTPLSDGYHLSLGSARHWVEEHGYEITAIVKPPRPEGGLL